MVNLQQRLVAAGHLFHLQDSSIICLNTLDAGQEADGPSCADERDSLPPAVVVSAAGGLALGLQELLLRNDGGSASAAARARREPQTYAAQPHPSGH